MKLTELETFWDSVQENESLYQAVAQTYTFMRDSFVYPDCPDKVKAPVINPSNSLAEIITQKEDYDNALLIYASLKEMYDNRMRVHQDAMCAFDSLFWRKLAEEYGVTDNPKLDRLQSKAYDDGHAYGYTEVYCKYTNLVGLIQ